MEKADVNTLVMLELIPGTEHEETLKRLVCGQLQMHCPKEHCFVATAIIGTEHESFLDIAREIDERARDALATEGSEERSIEQCAYIALRSFPINAGEAESYEIPALFVVFRRGSRILRRYTVPEYEDDTPAYVVVALDELMQIAGEKLPVAAANPHEDALADTIMDAVIAGFADYQRYCEGIAQRTDLS